jgi:hypothetical protein
VELIRSRLKFFQFYSYYITQIAEFININSLEVVSSEHVKRVIDEVNKKILEEITEPAGTDSNRLNLVKLLYYFFIDLSDNNPINIKLPKRILSVFFADKGFAVMKKRFDNFFSEEVFIQEAVDIIGNGTKRRVKPKKETEVSEQQVKEILTKAKHRLMDRDSSAKEIEKILKTHEKLIEIEGEAGTKSKQQYEEKSKTITEEKIYSEDLAFAQQLNEITPPVEITEHQKRESLINELFCEETFRKKIIKKLFSKEESRFRSFINTILQQKNWNDAVTIVEDFFNKKKINYYSEEAVKFVDILQTYFTPLDIRGSNLQEKIKAV